MNKNIKKILIANTLLLSILTMVRLEQSAKAESPTPVQKDQMHRSPSFPNLPKLAAEDTSPKLTLQEYMEKFDLFDLNGRFLDKELLTYSCNATERAIAAGKKILGSKPYLGDSSHKTQSIDLSFSSLASAFLERFKERLPNESLGSSFQSLRNMDIEAADPEEARLVEEYKEKCIRIADAAGLKWFLTDTTSPVKEAVDNCLHFEKGADQHLSGLNDSQIEDLLTILVGEVGSFKPLQFATDLSPDLKEKFKASLKKILKNKTGFQRMMAILIIYIWHREMTDLEFRNLDHPETTIGLIDQGISYYKPATKKICLTKKDFADDAITFHELGHAYHHNILPDSHNIRLSYVYFSIMNATSGMTGLDFKQEFLPMLAPDLISKLEAGKIKAPSLIKKAYQYGLGTLFSADSSSKIHNAIALHLSQTGITRDGTLDKPYDNLWETADELLNMWGTLPMIYGGQLFILEDRQNDIYYAKRSEEYFPDIIRKATIFHNGRQATAKVTDFPKPFLTDIAEEELNAYRTKTVIKPLVYATAEDEEEDYTCELNDAEKTLTILANANEISAGDFADIPENIEKIVFQDNSRLSEIPELCFFRFKNLKRIDFGKNSSLKRIRSNAFNVEGEIEQIINLPKSLERIEDNAFVLKKYSPEKHGFEKFQVAKITFEDNESSLQYVGYGNFDVTKLDKKDLPVGLSKWVILTLTKNYGDCFQLSDDGKTLTLTKDLQVLPEMDIVFPKEQLDKVEQIVFPVNSKIVNLDTINFLTNLKKIVNLPLTLARFNEEIKIDESYFMECDEHECILAGCNILGYIPTSLSLLESDIPANCSKNMRKNLNFIILAKKFNAETDDVEKAKIKQEILALEE